MTLERFQPNFLLSIHTFIIYEWIRKYAEPLSSSCLQIAETTLRLMLSSMYSWHAHFVFLALALAFSVLSLPFNIWRGLHIQSQASKPFPARLQNSILASETLLQQMDRLLKLELILPPSAEISIGCKSVLSLMLQQWQQVLSYKAVPLHVPSAGAIA